MRTEATINIRPTINDGAMARRPGDQSHDNRTHDASTHLTAPIRMLRLAQVRAMTGLGKTKIYELQAEGDFPMRIKLTGHCVAWIEDEMQSWLAGRVRTNAPLSTL